ncbi:MAG: hypothetical protein Q4C49_00750 [Bacillota bacterium]|nr:hypothetical protein [Bacillota bacterium]
MANVIKIVECSGYTKDEAFKDLQFNPNDTIVPGANATQAWNKAGRPIPGTQEFMRFVTQQLEEKTKNKPGYGIHIALDTAIPDKRRRPYTIVNNKTEGTREWDLVYFVREDELSVESLPEFTPDYDGEMEVTGESVTINVAKPGLIVAQCDSKAAALSKVKELTTETHKNYSILAVKVPDIAPIAAFCIYTPSKSAKMGTYIAVGINAEN